MKRPINNFLILRILNFILNILSKILFKNLNIQPKNIVIYRTGNLGDLVCGFTSFYSIKKKFPESKIFLITSKGSGKWGAAEIFTNNIFFDEIIEYNKHDLTSLKSSINFIKKIRKLKIDLWIDYGNQINTFTFFVRQIFLIKIFNAQSLWLDKCISYKKFVNYQEKNFFFTTEMERLNNFIKSKGVSIINIPKKLLHDDYYIKSKLFKKNFVVISLGSAQPHLNFWDEKKFTEVINFIAKSHQVILIGTKSDQNKAKRITKFINRDIINLVGLTKLKNLFAIFHASKIVIGLDTGTQHIAAFEGTNVITITSCWNFENTWTPSGPGTIISIRNQRRSKKCLLNLDNKNRRSCANIPQCIEFISSNSVIKEIKKIL